MAHSKSEGKEAVLVKDNRRSKVSRSPNDKEFYVPLEYEGNLQANYFCRYWNKGRSKYCHSRAGSNTSHKGEGRCRRHGGGNEHSITHGATSKYRSIKGKQADYLEREDYLDLREELALNRALTDDFLERFEEDREARLAWYASFDKGYTSAFNEWKEKYYDYLSDLGKELLDEGIPPPPKPYAERPRQILDISDAAKLTDFTGKTAERIHKIAAESNIGAEQFKSLLTLHGVEVIKAVKKIIKDEQLAFELCETIGRAWDKIDY